MSKKGKIRKTKAGLNCLMGCFVFLEAVPDVLVGRLLCHVILVRWNKRVSSKKL